MWHGGQLTAHTGTGLCMHFLSPVMISSAQGQHLLRSLHWISMQAVFKVYCGPWDSSAQDRAYKEVLVLIQVPWGCWVGESPQQSWEKQLEPQMPQSIHTSSAAPWAHTKASTREVQLLPHSPQELAQRKQPEMLPENRLQAHTAWQTLKHTLVSDGDFSHQYHVLLCSILGFVGGTNGEWNIFYFSSHHNLDNPTLLSSWTPFSVLPTAVPVYPEKWRVLL